MSKNYLFLYVKGAACAEECKVISALLRHAGITFVEKEWVSEEEFRESHRSEKYDAIYLAAHANGDGFGVAEGSELTPWAALASALCVTDAMVPNGLLFLGCCRGGMKVVALEIMQICPKIDYVAGPNWNAKAGDLVLGFNVFVNSLNRYGEEPTVAARRASEAAAQKFCCCDRQEMAGEIAMMQQLNRMEADQQRLREEVGQANAVLELLLDKVSELSPKNAPAPVT